MNGNKWVVEMVTKYQENDCLDNKRRIKNIIFASLYEDGVNYAKFFLRNKVFSDLVDYETEEIKSYVAIALNNAIEKFEVEKNMMFKNYFLLLVRFETLSELKHVFNWRVIPNFQNIRSEYLNNNNVNDTENKKLIKIGEKIKINKIYKYLESKNVLYAEMWKLKSIGFANKDIAEKMNLSPDIVKSKFQYIKKIITNKYQDLDDVV